MLPLESKCVSRCHTTKVIAHKASYSKLRPKIGWHGNLPQHRWTPSNTWFLRPIQAHNPNGISIGLAVFAQITAESPYTLQWDTTFPLKIALFHGGIWTPSNTWFLGLTRGSTQTAPRSVQPFLQGSLVWQTDRQTDRPRYSVGNNRPHLRT